MVGKTTFDYSFAGSEKAKTTTCASKVKTKNGTSIDPALVFQPFIYFTQTGDVSMIDVIGYELCPYPPALFESTILMLEADKPALATALRQVTGKVSPDSDSTTADRYYRSTEILVIELILNLVYLRVLF